MMKNTMKIEVPVAHLITARSAVLAAAVESYTDYRQQWRLGGHYLAEIRKRVRAELATYRSLGGDAKLWSYWLRIQRGGAR
jgi:hypothetical protein